MRPWMIFIVGSFLMIMVIVGGLLLNRRKQPAGHEKKRLAEDARILYLLLWLASLSIMAYIAFAFGKR